MKNKTNPEMLERMKNDPSNWRGPFYYNPKDHRLFVPKYNKYLGATLNMANPKVYLFFILIIAGLFLASGI